jgi:hypothetical protein
MKMTRLISVRGFDMAYFSFLIPFCRCFDFIIERQWKECF